MQATDVNQSLSGSNEFNDFHDKKRFKANGKGDDKHSHVSRVKFIDTIKGVVIVNKKSKEKITYNEKRELILIL